MRIYIPNISKQQVGGGFTYIRNLTNAISPSVQIARRWEDCDILLIAGISIVDKNEVYAAHKAGKKIVLRVDNVPRKSRNRRQTPHERLAEFAKLSDVVVYQSAWAKNYIYPLCGDGPVIYNGVDKKIFNTDGRAKREHDRFLFVYHGNNEQKQFWAAHYLYQLAHREDPDREFWFIYDFGREYEELRNAQFDFWQGEKYRHLHPPIALDNMPAIYKQCTHLIHPAIMDAAPNTVLEARACGLEIVGVAPAAYSGTEELLNPDLDISAERMGEEYIALFRLLMEPGGDI